MHLFHVPFSPWVVPAANGSGWATDRHGYAGLVKRQLVAVRLALRAAERWLGAVTDSPLAFAYIYIFLFLKIISLFKINIVAQNIILLI